MRRLFVFLALGGLLAAGCGDDEPAPRPSPKRPNEVSGPGFTTVRPAGFSGGAVGQEGVVLSLVGPYRANERFPPSVTVDRAPAPPRVTAQELRRSLRAQERGQGARDLQQLPDREIDGESAVGLISSRTAPRTEVTQRTYAVVHDRGLYTIGAATAKTSTVDVEKILETVLDAWRWR